jgi:hypothetical protein
VPRYIFFVIAVACTGIHRHIGWVGGHDIHRLAAHAVLRERGGMQGAQVGAVRKYFMLHAVACSVSFDQ